MIRSVAVVLALLFATAVAVPLGTTAASADYTGCAKKPPGATS